MNLKAGEELVLFFMGRGGGEESGTWGIFFHPPIHNCSKKLSVDLVVATERRKIRSLELS
jgi:hypothetical protein